MSKARLQDTRRLGRSSSELPARGRNFGCCQLRRGGGRPSWSLFYFRAYWWREGQPGIWRIRGRNHTNRKPPAQKSTIVSTTDLSRSNTSQFAVSSTLHIWTFRNNTLPQFLLLHFVMAPDPWTLHTDSVPLRNIPCWRSFDSHSMISRTGAIRWKYRCCDHNGYNTAQSARWLLTFTRECTASWTTV